MALDILFENFSLLMDAPHSVQKMRELILQMAVQGKLLPQDPNDEPASELLKRIKDEKERLVKEGKIVKSKPLKPIDQDEIPFDLPDTWLWLRLRDISYHFGQEIPSSSFTYIDVSSINKERGFISDEVKIISPEDAPSRARKLVSAGTVIYSTVRPYLLNIAIIDRLFEPKPIVSTAFAVIHPFSGILNKFVYFFLRSKPFINFVESEMSGMAYPAISETKLNKALIPIPPFEEQKRIVAKVDQLMALCDELETRHQKALDKRTQLNNSAIDNLLAAQDADEFADHWQLICDNFDLLYDNPESIDRLRQAILQLAIQGKLVPQNPNDEPASELLKRIKAEKDLLIKDGKIKKSKPLPAIDPSLVLYEIPNSWELVRFGDICSLITDGVHKTPRYTNSGIPFISVNNLRNNIIDFNRCKFISKKEHLELTKRCKPEMGDILLGKVGSIGVCDVVNVDFEFSIFVQLALLKPLHVGINNYFLRYAILSKMIRSQIFSDTAGTALKYIGIGKIQALITPLPPLDEQKRIVEKVEQLMALCDGLQLRLNQSKENSDNLLDAVLYETLDA